MSSFVRETMALTRRWFLHTLRQPIAVAAGLFQPLIWLFLFGSLFHQLRLPVAAGGVEVSYIPFLAAGVIVFTAFNSALATGVPVLFDKENRFLERLLVAPLRSRFSIVAASALHIFVMSWVQTAIVMLVVDGWSADVSLGLSSFFGVLLVTSLLILGFTVLSIGLAFGLRAHFEMLSLIQVVSLPMVFVSSAFAPVSLMPAWLQWPATLNPLTATIEPVRALILQGRLPAGPLLEAPWGTLGFAGCVGYLLVFDLVAVLAVGAFLRRYLR